MIMVVHTYTNTTEVTNMSLNYNRTIRSTGTYSLSDELATNNISTSSDAWDVALDVVDEALDVIDDCAFFFNEADVDDIDDCIIFNA